MSAGLAQVETSLVQAPSRDGDQFVLVQECFRHFDLDLVGTDGIHLSLFEMPAAFVFTPNGKEENIRQIWEWTTSVMGMEANQIWVSYFKGGKVLNEYVPGDEGTRHAWMKMGIPEDRIVGLGVSQNYWVQGTGISGMETSRKAGPNTELFYDRGVGRSCGPTCRPGCKCGRFVEFANTLHICRELDSTGTSLRPMTEPFAETVIGTERVAMICQGVQSVYDTDVYHPIIEAIRGLTCALDLPEPLLTASLRVIADHLRALYVLAIDGAPKPGKNGRQRIIKRLVRGVITRQIILGIELGRSLPILIDCIPQELNSHLQGTQEDRRRLKSYFSAESPKFLKTIERGLRQLERLLTENHGRSLSGHQIVHLEKKWGLPHSLTARILWDKGLIFSGQEYRDSLKEWKEAHGMC